MEKLKNIKKDRVTRDDIRGIEVGQVGRFELPNQIAVYNARVAFSTMKRLYGMQFERVEGEHEPLTVAYRRVK